MPYTRWRSRLLRVSWLVWFTLVSKLLGCTFTLRTAATRESTEESERDQDAEKPHTHSHSHTHSHTQKHTHNVYPSKYQQPRTLRDQEKHRVVTLLVRQALGLSIAPREIYPSSGPPCPPIPLSFSSSSKAPRLPLSIMHHRGTQLFPMFREYRLIAKLSTAGRSTDVYPNT